MYFVIFKHTLTARLPNTRHETVSTNQPVIIVGLTGGIASGKSTVTTMLRELGIHVIDADQIARQIVEPGQPALGEIVEAFGPDILDASGQLDRPALGQKIFADPALRKQLNAITHPRIAQAMMENAREATNQGHPFVIYDAALLVENQIHKFLDSLIVVALDRPTQIERLISRDNITRAQAEQRIDSQMSLEEKIAVADFVINNHGSRELTRAQTQKVIETIRHNIQTRQTSKPLKTESTSHE